MESIFLQPYHWEYESKTDLEIRAWCLDRNSEAHLVRFKDFPPFCQLELPYHVGGRHFVWDANTAYQLFNCLQTILRDDAPTGFQFKESKDLYYYQGNTRKPFMMVKFRNLDAMRHMINILKKPIELRTHHHNYGLLQISVHEPDNDINCIRKMLTITNCQYSGWLKVTGTHPIDASAPKPEDDDYNDPQVWVKDAMGNTVLKDAGEVEYSISTFPPEREWIAAWHLLEMAPEKEVEGWMTQPKILGFDIEVYSDNHRVFPDMWNIVHCAFMISCVYQKGEDLSTRKRYAIIIGRTNHIPPEKLENTEVIEVNSELELIDNYCRIIRETDPDVISGYNILDFDYPYLDARLKLELQGWPFMGRLKGVKTELKSSTWESGGYGFNSINSLSIPGRISIDMFPVIKRDYKLLRYNLDTVAKHFLNRTKHDVSYTEMFLTYERNAAATDEYRQALQHCVIPEETAKGFHDHIKHFWGLAERAINATIREMDTPEAYEKWKAQRDSESPPKVETTATIPGVNPQTISVDASKAEGSGDNYNDPAKGVVYDRFGKLNWCSNQLWQILIEVATDAIASARYRPFKDCESLTPFILGQMQAAMYIMARVTVYCLIDSDLCIDLFVKLSTWVGLIEMSAVVGVTVTDLFTRGQQIRCLSQLYDLAAKKGIILNKRESPNIFFNGGFVFDVVPGLYDGVAVIDFNSLYPSIMQAYNICYTTLLRPEHLTMILDKNIPDSQKPFTVKDIHLVEVPRPDVDTNNYDADGVEDESAEVADEEERDVNGENIDPNYKPNKRVIREVVASLSGAVVDERNYYFGFVKDHILPGLLPAIVKYLVEERSAVREVQKAFPKGSPRWMVCEKRQLALKVSANSMFGFLGAGKMGKRPLIEGAMSITAIGRKLINFVNQFAITKYNAKIVYGDSVTGDTPILCRLGDQVFYRRIDDLPGIGPWFAFPGGKESRSPEQNLEVWTERGFTKLKTMIRHKTNKRLYRITTHTGSVKVTEDHSLLNQHAQEIKPSQVSIGTELLSNDLPNLDQGFSIDWAWAAGIFYGDGSCGIYDCPSGRKSSWAINNTNLDFLNKAKLLLDATYPRMEFKIYDTMASSGVYKLEVTGTDIADFVSQWRSWFYDKDRYKKVPEWILRCDEKTRRDFFDGYYAADGDKDANGYVRFDNKGCIGAAGLYLLSTSLGYNVSINTRKDKLEIYRLTLTRASQRRHPNKIKKIEDFGYVNDYVYDLETENHHFAAGVGRLVVHNTDSSMLDMHIENKKDYVAAGKAIAKEISAQFPPPLRLELEKVMKMLCLCKKKYAGYTYDNEGNFNLDKETGLPELLIRGIILARRDNAPWLRETYEKLLRMILDEVPFAESMRYLISQIRELVGGNINYNDLVTVRSVGAHYKNPNYFMKLFADNLSRIGKPVKPGERLGYLVMVPKTPEQEKYIGNRMVLPDMYAESQYTDNSMQLDYLYYLEKQFMNSLDQLLSAGYGKQMEKYASIKYRPNRRCKFTPLNEPVKMIVRMLRNNQNIDKIFESIKAVDQNEPRGPLLSEMYESSSYEYPTVTIQPTPPVFVVTPGPSVFGTKPFSLATPIPQSFTPTGYIQPPQSFSTYPVPSLFSNNSMTPMFQIIPPANNMTHINSSFPGVLGTPGLSNNVIQSDVFK